MRLEFPRNGRSALRTIVLVGPIAVALSVLLALVLFPGTEAGAGDQHNLATGVEHTHDGGHDANAPGPDAARDKEQIVETMLELMNQREFDCEQCLRLLIGIGEGEAIDNERVVRLLLGIDEGDDVDREQIFELLENLGEGG